MLLKGKALTSNEEAEVERPLSIELHIFFIQDKQKEGCHVGQMLGFPTGEYVAYTGGNSLRVPGNIYTQGGERKALGQMDWEVEMDVQGPRCPASF